MNWPTIGTLKSSHYLQGTPAPGIEEVPWLLCHFLWNIFTRNDLWTSLNHFSEASEIAQLVRLESSSCSLAVRPDMPQFEMLRQLQELLSHHLGLSENSVPRKTQWFCWSLSLLNGYNWGYTPFSDIPTCCQHAQHAQPIHSHLGGSRSSADESASTQVLPADAGGDRPPTGSGSGAPCLAPEVDGKLNMFWLTQRDIIMKEFSKSIPWCL